VSCLCYCICRHPGPETGPLLGVGNQPVYRLTHQRLSAAVSRLEPADLAPDLPRLRAYARVVCALHCQGPVIPLRYGAVVSQESRLLALLDEQILQYEALLRELEGCVEMGLRVLLPQTSLSPGAAGNREELPGSSAPPGRPGLTYLTARKLHYARQDRWTEEYRRAADRCQAQFTGLFVKCKTEAPSPCLPLLSLYFLVPRAMLAPFRQAFRRLSATESARLLLSGPWPPYNFVSGGISLVEF